MKKLLLLLLLITGSSSFGQEIEIICKGDRYFEQNQFESAIKYYIEDSKAKNKRIAQHAMLRVADCYRIIGEFEKAEIAYKKILKKRKNHAESYLNYGLSLKNSAKFEEAKLQFAEYIKLNPKDPMGNIYLLSCDSAQVWLDQTIGKEAMNVGVINTEESDFGPLIRDNKLYFCSSRKGSRSDLISFEGGNEINRMDIYNIDLTELGKEQLEKNDLFNLKDLNSSTHEGSMCMTKDGKEIYFTRNLKGKRNSETNNITNLLQIFYSKLDTNGKWSKPTNNLGFNSSLYSTGHPAISSDGNTIYFMADKPGGIGKTDIYYSEKDVTGTWSKPKNLGRNINTFGYELFPYLKNDSTLYFSSNAHPGMGQLDIFCVKKVNGKWDNVFNLKPPYNSIGNDFGICFMEGSERGFFASDRFNGKGAEDIYSFSEELNMTINLQSDSLFIPDYKVFDNVSVKLKNLTDSSEIDLRKGGTDYFTKLHINKVYELQFKKNGFLISSTQISLTGSALENDLKYLVANQRGPVNINYKNKSKNIAYSLILSENESRQLDDNTTLESLK